MKNAASSGALFDECKLSATVTGIAGGALSVPAIASRSTCTSCGTAAVSSHGSAGSRSHRLSRFSLSGVVR